ncbi:TPA: 50S ribosomal protein L1 [Candidatus Dependentiae bacterium]|nr:MAG: 50S ribosomal protein L1 [candidate division TM6 bacterium GW2011_GWF2_36_131]KKQ02869.1 MAG: 50S ribosomal protein L1 [candidate division TM6 bacterium GW2011_GWE2_36_25]KKQ19522.1 MAG: 50S ribosomal protein L1 [candidate division TM6 bacterium GW2011_GWA2_36_9]HBR70235.1 50S ribosomal protein L1 [Candidatus Dependentiae bacterium]HCU00619.1 50S ribosomal protein L1 [Candidatus Dependentiae bacterium]
MATRGKKYKTAIKVLGGHKKVAAQEAISEVKKVAYAKFDETVGVDINLGIDAGKSEQAVRGSVMYPHGVGKKSRVVVFAKDKYADEAEKAGADFVGAEDLIEKVLGGWLEFDNAVATPDMMGAVGKLAKLLGPRGLLPNKKVGTVTFDVGSIVAELKKGKTFFKSDRTGLLHVPIGKKSFEEQKLHENFLALMKSVVASRPAAAKGRFIKKVAISSTMGPGIEIAIDDMFKV